MIVVKLIGGLGNQLFQYAAGLQLANNHNVPLKLDANAFKEYKLRKIDLQNFQLDYDLATDKEINSLKNESIWNGLKNRLLPYSYKSHYKEPYFHFNPSYYLLGSNVYLQGYFQSEKYFTAIKEQIHSKFKLKDDITVHLQSLANELNNKNSVSIHIRAGDYSLNKTADYHGILSKEYYTKAIQIIKDKIPNAEFYLFSDEIEKAKMVLTDQPIQIISRDVATNHLEDFYLMSQCKHNIIANSSFSWWATWLNPNPDKIVIAPKKWFNKGPQDTQDLFPSSWIQLD